MLSIQHFKKFMYSSIVSVLLTTILFAKNTGQYTTILYDGLVIVVPVKKAAQTTPPVLAIDDIIDFDHKLPNRIQNGSFELGIGAEPIYFGWERRELDEANGALDAPDYPVIDTTTAMEGNASVKIARIKKYQHIHIDFTPPDITDEDDNSSQYQGYIYADLKTDCPGEMKVHFPLGDAWPDATWKRFRKVWPKNKHRKYDFQARRIYVYNKSDKECTLWVDGLTWTVKDVAMDRWLRFAKVEAVFLPERDDDIHFADRDVKLRYRMNATDDVKKVVVELHLRDITRDGVDLSQNDPDARYTETLTLTPGEVIERTINLHRLKRGAYMAHLAFYDPETRKILGVARERFTVMEDLRKKPAPVDFVVGTNGGLFNFGAIYEFSMRGSWSADDFYRTSYLVGLRTQRIADSISVIMPQSNTYDFNIVKEMIQTAHEHNCSVVLNLNPFQIKNADKPVPTGHPGDWIFQADRNLTDHLGQTNREVYGIPLDQYKTLFEKVADQFGDKLLALEVFNEINLFYKEDRMGYAVDDFFKPIYNLVKRKAPNLPIMPDFTMDYYGSEFTTHFMDANGTKYSDGFTYHPYGRTFIYAINKWDHEEPGIAYMKRMERYRDRYKETKKLIIGMTEIQIASRYAVGWDVVQRALLDWSGGARFSIGMRSGGLYFLETGHNDNWQFTFTKAPGPALVALNGMYGVLGGYKLLKRVDWDDENNHGVLIVLFKKPGEEKYAVAMAQGDFAHKRAVLNVGFPADAKFYDQWGEPIDPERPVKLSNEILYMTTTDSSVKTLFDDYNNAVSWSDEPNGYDYSEGFMDGYSDLPSDEWLKTLLRTGIPLRTKRTF